MARQRKTTVSDNNKGEVVSVFETMTQEEWVDAGAGSSAQKGEYATILASFVETGRRFAKIATASDSGGRFAGKKAASITTALKNARDSKSAPDGVGDHIKVSSKDGVIYLENTLVEA